MTTKYIKSFDGLRGIAIITVMTLHYGLTEFGWVGVQLFFVLSGFLITGILWREKSQDSSLGKKLCNFWIRRSLRIFPLYFGYLFILFVTYLLFKFPDYYISFIPFLSTYTFNFTRITSFWKVTPLFTHLWSLCIEEQFYIFFPFVVYVSSRRVLIFAMVAVIIVSPLIRFFIGQYYCDLGLSPEVVADGVYWNTLSHLDAFFIGGAIPVMGLQLKKINHTFYFYVMLCFVLLVGAINFYLYSDNANYFADLGYGIGHIEHGENVWHYSVLNIFFGTLILALLSERQDRLMKGIHNLLESSWLVNIGKVSYGMYIFHWACFTYLVSRFVIDKSIYVKILLFIPYVLLVYLISYISFHLYEKWFIEMKNKFAR